MKHTTPIQLRFNDADALGHVNNSVYFNYFDLGKTDYFRALHGHNYYSDPIDIIIAHVEVDFLAPVFLTENIAVQTEIVKIGNKSMTLNQQVIDADNGNLKCTCKTIMVGFDFEKKTTIAIPDKWHIALYNYNNKQI